MGPSTLVRLTHQRPIELDSHQRSEGTSPSSIARGALAACFPWPVDLLVGASTGQAWDLLPEDHPRTARSLGRLRLLAPLPVANPLGDGRSGPVPIFVVPGPLDPFCDGLRRPILDLAGVPVLPRGCALRVGVCCGRFAVHDLAGLLGVLRSLLARRPGGVLEKLAEFLLCD